MTPKPINEEQLLAFIEGELTDDEAGHLRRSIEQRDPALASRLDAMAGDRAALRELPAVDPPADFLAEIEPMIARPMLMDSQAAPPGAVRRARHRRHRHMQFLQAAAAAAIVIGLSIGVLFAVDAIGIFHSTSQSTVASSGSAATPAGADNTADAEDSVLDAAAPADGELHHMLPSPARMTSPAHQRAGTDDPSSSPTPTPNPAPDGVAPSLVHADFALVLSADDRQAAEASLIAALNVRSEVRSTHTALVRNLTVDELRGIEQRWMARRAAAGNPVRVPRTADVDGGDAQALNSTGDRLRVPRTLLNENADELVRAGLVAGNRELMPPYSRQIELSRSGAAYTVAVPLAELQSMLERLNSADIRSAALRAFDVQPLSSGNQAAALDDAGWPRQLRRIRATIAELQRDNPDAVLLLPIVVERALE